MPRIVYITEKPSDGVMASFGMKVHSHNLKEPIRPLLVELKRNKIALVYVTEAIFRTFEKEINALNHDFDMSIIVLDSEDVKESLGAKRLKRLIEDAVGIKVE